MRVYELLFEYSEKIDRRRYGGWILPNGEIHYVESHGHKEALPGLGIRDGVLGKAFDENFVHFQANDAIRGEELGIAGTQEAIRKQASTIVPSIVNRDLQLFTIQIQTKNQYGHMEGGRTQVFRLPQQRTAAIAAVTGKAPQPSKQLPQSKPEGVSADAPF